MERGRRQEPRQFGGRPDERGRGIGRSPRQQRPVDEPARQVDGDEVEHQRRHDLVDVEPRAQETRRDEPGAADDRGAGESKGNEQRARPVGEAIARDRGDDAAEIEAALRADVENAGPERDRRGEPGQQERRRLRQRGRNAPFAAEGFFDHQSVDRDRLVAGEGENNGADADRERKGGYGGARLPKPLGGRPAGHAALWPSIMRPSPSTLACARPISPVIRPL